MKRVLLFVIPAVVLLIIIAIFFTNRNSLFGNRRVPASVSALINQAKDLESQGELLQARNIYQKVINDIPGSAEIMNWQKKVEELNIKLLFSPAVTPGSVLYEVKRGDTLTKIAKEFNTTIELIMKSNNLGSDRITPGMKIKVWKTPFTIFVDKSQNILLLKSQEEVFKAYIVSTGKNNCTPVGNFKVTTKLTNPTWFKSGAVIPPDSADNVLGTRWMGFDLAGYGIHGTIEPQNLGKQVTEGCVRMNNSEVEELYTIIPVGTEVTIVD